MDVYAAFSRTHEKKTPPPSGKQENNGTKIHQTVRHKLRHRGGTINGQRTQNTESGFLGLIKKYNNTFYNEDTDSEEESEEYSEEDSEKEKEELKPADSPLITCLPPIHDSTFLMTASDPPNRRPPMIPNLKAEEQLHVITNHTTNQIDESLGCGLGSAEDKEGEDLQIVERSIELIPVTKNPIIPFFEETAVVSKKREEEEEKERLRKRPIHVKVKDWIKAKCMIIWLYIKWIYNESGEYIFVNTYERYGLVIWYKILATLQWIFMIVAPRSGKSRRRYGHLFKPIGVMDRSDRGNGKGPHFIKIVEDINRYFMWGRDMHKSFIKVIILCIITALVVYFGFYYVTTTVELNTNIRPVFYDDERGMLIENLYNIPPYKPGHDHDTRYLLSPDNIEPSTTQRLHKKYEPLTTQRLHKNYVEIFTRKFGRVNISIAELVVKMKEDAKRYLSMTPSEDDTSKREGIARNCMCAVHYGIPLNIILYTGSDGEQEHIFYEPEITAFSSFEIRGALVQDPLGVPPMIKAIENEMNMKGCPWNGYTSRLQSINERALTYRIPQMVQHYRTPTSITRNRIYVEKTHCGEEDNTESNCLVDIQESTYRGMVTDLTHHIYKIAGNGGVRMYDREDPTRDISSLPQEINEYVIPEDFLKNLEVKTNPQEFAEMTFAYSHIVLRGLSQDGERFTAIEIPSPGSICIQRCLSATDALLFLDLHGGDISSACGARRPDEL